MKKFCFVLIVILLLPAFAGADSWSVTIPSDDRSFAVLNVIIENGKFYVVGAEVDGNVAGYEYSESLGCYNVKMEDGQHAAMIMGDKLFYELVPDGFTLLMDRVEPFDVRFTSTDGTFNHKALIEARKEKTEGPTSTPEPVQNSETQYAEIPYEVFLEAALADDVDESYYVGSWVNISQHANGTGETMSVMDLTDDHYVYFLIYSIRKSDDPPGTGRAAYKTWSASGNKVHVIIGNNTSMDLRVIDQDHMYNVDRPYEIYVRLGSAEIGE